MTEQISQPTRIFISYRRSDSTADPGRIEDWLKANYGGENVFRDSSTILPGQDFPQQIETWIRQSSLILVVIGERWARKTPEAPLSLLLQQDDWVRRELEIARESNKPIIPVRISDAPSPSLSDLPNSLAFLPALQEMHFPLGADFSAWTENLRKAITRTIESCSKANTERTVDGSHFRDFITEHLPCHAESYDSHEIRDGLAELYSMPYKQLKQICLTRNSFTLLEARRGIGKSFLLRRLHDDAARQSDNRTISAFYAWDTPLIEQVELDDLQSRLASLLLWGICNTPGSLPGLQRGLFHENWDLFNRLVTLYQERPALSLREAATVLGQEFQERNPVQIKTFAQDISSAAYQCRQLKETLLANGVGHLFLFIDDFTDRIVVPRAHDRFFRLLLSLRKTLNPEIACTVVVGIYPCVTSLSEFRDGQDGRVVSLEYKGSWSDWHRQIAYELIHRQFSVYCSSRGLPIVDESTCTGLRNTLFEGNAVKRLSFLANRSPRQYIMLLQEALAGLGLEKVSTRHLAEIAREHSDREYVNIRAASSRFAILNVEASVVERVYQGVINWVKYACTARRAEQGAPTLSLKVDRTANHGVVNCLRMLSFLGVVNLRESPHSLNVELSPLVGLLDIVNEGDLERASEAFPVDRPLLDSPATARSGDQAPSEPGRPRTKKLSDFGRKRLSDKHLGFDLEKLKDLDLASRTISEVAIYSPTVQRFYSRKALGGVKLAKDVQRMVESRLELYLAREGISILDDSEQPSRVDLLATPIEKLGLAGSVRKKLTRAGIVTLADVVAEYADPSGYRFSEPKCRKACLSEKDKKALSARVGEMLSDFRITKGLHPTS